MQTSPHNQQIASAIKAAVAQSLAALPPERIAFTIDQAAAAVGLPRNTLRDRVSSGELPARKRCGKWLILRSDLLRWLQED